MHAEHDAARHRERERRHPADQRGGECEQQQARPERDAHVARALVEDGPDEQRAHRCQSTPARTHTWVDTVLHPDARERRRVRVVGGGAHGEPEAGALEQEREHDDDERHRDEHDELVAAHDDVSRCVQRSLIGRRDR